MRNPTLDVVVVGAGHAGLSISYHLQQQGTPHVVLERGHIGESWRSQRWDSFSLNSPNRFNLLPGGSYSGTNPDGFDTAGAFVSSLEKYAETNQLPVQQHARVSSIERSVDGYRVTVARHATNEQYRCRRVVVASGALSEPRIPAISRRLSPEVQQCHAGMYRRPAALPQGAVLVVGSAQTGLQIAEDLLDAGRRVYLSTSAVGRVPRRYRGRDIFEWFLKTGFFDVKTEDVTDPREREAKQPQVSGTGPLGHSISLQSLAGSGAVIIGKVDSINGKIITLRPDAAHHVKFADEVSGRIKRMIDGFIAKHQPDTPQPEPDPADAPDIKAACASQLASLDLGKEQITSIIWATGFTGDFGYLNGHGTDGGSSPVHREGVSNAPGLYFVGMPWLRKRKSGIINGIVEDAAFIAERVKETL